MIKFLILLYCYFVCIQCRQLSMIQQTFRHGARYPVFPSKYDSSDMAQKTNNLGELTIQGKHMHYMLGKIIQQKYWDQLFGGTQFQNVFHQSQFYIKSTDKNRTIQSAQSHLYGLLEKLPKLELSKGSYQFSLPAWVNLQLEKNVSQTWSVFDSGPSFHPTAIHVQKRQSNVCDDGDFLTKYDEENCPNQMFWSSENFESDQNSNIMRDQRIKQTVEALSKALGTEVQFEDVYKWKDSQVCLKYLGLKYLPIFEDPKHSKIIDFIQVYSMYLNYFAQTPQIKAVASNYFKQTLGNLQGKISGKFSPKIVIYSGHDTTIAMVLAAMNFTNINCIVEHYLNGGKNDDTCIWQYPQYTANFIFQLWNNNGDYTVRMLYNGQIRKIPICGYKTECTIAEFRNWVNEFVVSDVNLACGFVGKTKTFYALMFLLSSIITILIFYICYLHAKIQKIDTVARAKRQGYIDNFEEKHHQEIKI